MDIDGNQSPLLRVNPGDRVLITLANVFSSVDSPAMPGEVSIGCDMDPNDMPIDSTSVNIHFHGMNISPTCHADDVVNTIVNMGQIFVYDFLIPNNNPPGLYAYHDHIHSLSSLVVLGGASGAIIVNGIENFQPLVAGLLERVIILRDYSPPESVTNETDVPSWDISINYVSVPFPNYHPAIIAMQSYDQPEFWRMVNAASDTIFYLQILYDGVPQDMQVVAFDGVPFGSQDGYKIPNTTPSPVNYTELFFPPYARAEFIFAPPSPSVKNATMVTFHIDTGPYGDYDPFRTIANIVVNPQLNIDDELYYMPYPTNKGNNNDVNFGNNNNNNNYGSQRFAGLFNATVAMNRTIYFSEILSNSADPDGRANFFITVEGQTPVTYNSTQPPAVISTQGTTEDWIVQNRAKELHIFHIHQIHFLLLERNGIPVAIEDQQYLDTVKVDYWSGNTSEPYPNVKIRLDFRGADVGLFVYHCHILDHEDAGMMAKILVVAPPSPPSQNDKSHDNRSSNYIYQRNLAIGMSFLAVGVLAIIIAAFSTLRHRNRKNIANDNGGGTELR